MSDGSIGEKRPKSRDELCRRLAEALVDELQAADEYKALAAGMMEGAPSRMLQRIAMQEAWHRCVLQGILAELCPCELEGEPK